MANPNPSPATRFSAENPGSRRAKQKGARDRLSAALLTALADDFAQHGKATVEKVRTEDPTAYLRIMAAVVPKELEISRPIEELSDEDLAALIEHVRSIVPAEAGETGPGEADKPAARLN